MSVPQNHLSGTFGRGKMKRMQSTPLIVSRPDRQDCNIAAAAVNLSPIFSANDSTSVAMAAAAVVADHHCSGLSALSTLYGEKVTDFTVKPEENEFSRWLGPKIAGAKSQLDGTYIEKAPETVPADPSDKENRAAARPTDGARTDVEQPVLSDIQNKRNAPPRPTTPEKSSAAPVRRQTSSVWLNSSREYAKEPSNDDDTRDMEELHTELDKILDQLQKLVT